MKYFIRTAPAKSVTGGKIIDGCGPTSTGKTHVAKPTSSADFHKPLPSAALYWYLVSS